MQTPEKETRTSSAEQRFVAVQAALQEHGIETEAPIEALAHLALEQWITQNSARVVAKAWVDSAFRERLIANGHAAVTELDVAMPKHPRHLVVLQNTPTVHNVICCTLCSCTAFTLIGLPPDWNKDLAFASLVVI